MIISFFTSNRTIYPPIFRVIIGFLLLFDLLLGYSSGVFLYAESVSMYGNQSGWVSFFRGYYQWLTFGFGITLVLFIIGIGKNITSFWVFIFLLVFTIMQPNHLTWGDIILRFTMLYFIIINSFTYLSINPIKESNYLSKLGIYSVILNIFLIYTSNSFYKILDLDWQQGFATYFAFNQFDSIKTSILYPVISNAFLSKILTYVVIAEQLLFTPLIIFKKTRVYMLLVGIFIHVTMLIFMGLWKFELVVILLYGFLLTDEDWEKILPKVILNRIKS